MVCCEPEFDLGQIYRNVTKPEKSVWRVRGIWRASPVRAGGGDRRWGMGNMDNKLTSPSKKFHGTRGQIILLGSTQSSGVLSWGWLVGNFHASRTIIFSPLKFGSDTRRQSHSQNRKIIAQTRYSITIKWMEEGLCSKHIPS